MDKRVFIWKNTKIRVLGLGCALALAIPAVTDAQTVISNDFSEVASLSGATVEMYGRSELHITNSVSPISGCAINLHSIDSWVFLENVVPSSTISLLGQFKVDGAAAVNNSNVKIVQYGQGAVIIPYPSGFQPMNVYAAENFSGDSASLSPYTQYSLVLSGKISSFTLKRGYEVTLAQNSDGTGHSVNYVAADGDLRIGALPEKLHNQVGYIRIFPWRWTTKKGIAGNNGSQLDMQWSYNWNIDQTSTLDKEYVPIRQTRWWPGLDQDWAWRGSSHLLGYNEPSHTDQANMTVADAIWSWPDLLWTGLRLGSPASADDGRSWLYEFMGDADAADLRVDFVACHYYWGHDPSDPAGAATQMYGFLKNVYDNTGHRPIWITEWNNGANWTGNDPTYAQQAACIAAMTEMLDNTPWVERYAPYNWVGDTRRLDWDDGSLTDAGVWYRDNGAPVAYQQIIHGKGMDSSATYHFENNLDDSSGSGNHALGHDYPDFVSGHNGGTALQFDGVDDHVILPDSLSDSTDFTFAAWVYWNGGGNWQRIFDFGIIDSGDTYMFLTPSNGSGVRFAINTGSGEQTLTSPNTLPQNTWTHVAVTLSGNTGTLYVNGASVASGTINANPSDLGAIQHWLGRSMFPNDSNFSGKLDDVVIKNEALAPTQISAIYAGNQTPTIVASPVDGGSAEAATLYSSSVAGSVADPEAGAISYSKVYGPDWVTVASDGTVSGTPGFADGGIGYLTIRATDPAGQSTSVAMEINVTVPPYDFSKGPIAYWDFAHSESSVVAGSYLPGNGERADLNGNGGMDTDDFRIGAADMSGNGNHLTAWTSSWMKWSANSTMGDFSMTDSGNGYPAANTDSAYNPDIQIAGYTKIDAEVVSPSAWTVEAVFRSTDLSGTRTFVGRDDNTGNLAAMYFSTRGTDLAIAYRDVAGNWHDLQVAAGLTVGAWYRVAATSDGTTLRLYRNGSLIGSQSISASANSSLAVGYGTWSIARGMYAGGHVDRFFGDIDAVSISGVALAPGSFLLGSDSTAPDAPTGLSTARSVLGIGLDWADNSEFDLCSYTVYRSTTSGGGYSIIASGLIDSEYMDGSVANDTPYYYVVTATDYQSNESSTSSEVSDSVVYTDISPDNADFDQCTQENHPTGFDLPYDVPGWQDGSTITDAGVENSAWWVPYDNYSAFMNSGDSAYLLSNYTIKEGDEFKVSFFAKGWATYNNTPGAEWTVTLFYGTDPHANAIGTYNTGALVQGDSVATWANYVTSISATSNSVGQKLGILFESTGPSGSYANLDEVALNVLSQDPPEAPVNLSASSGDAQITLTWDAVADADSYNIKRSLSHGGTYSIVTNQAVNHIVDSGLTNGTVYYYVVTSVGSTGESTNSVEVSAIPSQDIVSSEFHILDFALEGGTTMSFTVSNSIVGHRYGILATDSLTSPAWSNVLNTAGVGSTLQIKIPFDPASSNRYYKLDVHRY